MGPLGNALMSWEGLKGTRKRAPRAKRVTRNDHQEPKERSEVTTEGREATTKAHEVAQR